MEYVWPIFHAFWFFCASFFFLLPSGLQASQSLVAPAPEAAHLSNLSSWDDNQALRDLREGTEGRPLSISEAITTALAANPDLELASARVHEAREMIAEARAAFWPSLQLYTEYLRGDAPSVHAFKRLDQRRLPLVDFDFNEPGVFQNFESGMLVHFNVFKGGEHVFRERIARKGLRVQELDRNAVTNDLVASVIGAYFDALAAGDHVNIADQSVETVKSQLHSVRVRYEGGSVLRSDLLSTEVRLAQAIEERIRAKNRHALSLLALAHVMGLQQTKGLELSGGSWVPPTIPPCVEEGTRVALASRPELRQIREKTASARMGVGLERSAYLPALDLHIKAYVDDEKMKYDADRGNWTVGFLLSWNLFTGFSTPARVNQARARLAQAEAGDRQVSQAVILDVKRAYFLHSEAHARLKVTGKAASQAEEAFRLVQIEYDRGSAGIVRYLDAELAKNSALVAQAAAFYDFRRSQADVARALGHFATD